MCDSYAAALTFKIKGKENFIKKQKQIRKSLEDSKLKRDWFSLLMSFTADKIKLRYTYTFFAILKLFC